MKEHRITRNKTEMHGIRFCVILLVSVLFCVQRASAYAQTFSLGIYPPLLEVMIQPGKSITQVYKIKNSGEDLVLVPNIVSFEPVDELGNISLQIPNSTFRRNPAKRAFQVPSWFSLLNANRSLNQAFSLPSGKTEELILKIKIPKEVPEADHYFSLILTTSPTPLIGQTKMGMRGVIASNILLTISEDGSPRKLAEIEEFSCKKFLDSFDKPVFTVKIKNIGNTYFKPTGNISVKNQTLDLLEENILAHSTRQIRCKSGDEVILCQFEAKFLFGRYKAELNFKVNGENYQAETIFWALPIKAGLGLLTIVVLLFMIKSRIK